MRHMASSPLAVCWCCGTIAPTANYPETVMPEDASQKLHTELGIPADYATKRGLRAYRESTDLIDIGPNLVGRMQRLTPSAASKWQQMVEAAAVDNIRLLLVSGFRSYDYQATLIRNKLDRGQCLDDILKVNAAPGYSQHHSGNAIDIATPGTRPLTEGFEDSDAFAWLHKNANKFDFSMTYPRNNPSGIIYEPWHWSL